MRDGRSMEERFLGTGRIEPDRPRRHVPSWARTLLRGIRRLVVVATVAGAICLGLGLLLAHVRGGDTWHTVAVVFYVVGAVATLAALGLRGRPVGAYGGYESSESVQAANAAKAMNLVIGIMLIALGVLIDTVAH